MALWVTKKEFDALVKRVEYLESILNLISIEAKKIDGKITPENIDYIGKIIRENT
jgi:hypothetical protein